MTGPPRCDSRTARRTQWSRVNDGAAGTPHLSDDRHANFYYHVIIVLSSSASFLHQRRRRGAVAFIIATRARDTGRCADKSSGRCRILSQPRNYQVSKAVWPRKKQRVSLHLIATGH